MHLMHVASADICIATEIRNCLIFCTAPFQWSPHATDAVRVNQSSFKKFSFVAELKRDLIWLFLSSNPTDADHVAFKQIISNTIWY